MRKGLAIGTLSKALVVRCQYVAPSPHLRYRRSVRFFFHEAKPLA